MPWLFTDTAVSVDAGDPGAVAGEGDRVEGKVALHVEHVAAGHGADGGSHAVSFQVRQRVAAGDESRGVVVAVTAVYLGPGVPRGAIEVGVWPGHKAQR